MEANVASTGEKNGEGHKRRNDFMADALSAVEAAITELEKARQSVSRGKSKQVTSSDEIARLKSVAFAWFKTHRPVASEHPSRPDLSEVDSAYQAVMEATGRRSTRPTYAKAFRAARNALVPLRGYIAANLHAKAAGGSIATNDTPPNFGLLAADARMQVILQRRWGEVQRCLGCTANLAATVMMGGLLESLLLARINSSANKAAVFKAKSAPRDKSGTVLQVREWKLVDMVNVAHEVGWITKSAKDVGNVLRDFRNYIHPHKEYTDDVSILDEDARMFWEVSKSITRHVLGSVGKSP